MASAIDEEVLKDIATAEEISGLKELRAAVEADIKKHLTEDQQKYPELTGEIRLLRFLRGFKLVVEDAADSYRKMLAFYEQEKVGDIRAEIVAKNMTLQQVPFTDEIAHYYYNNVWHNEDKNGNIIDVDFSGQLDAKELLRNVTPEQFLRWHLYNMEIKMLFMDAQSRKQRRMIRCLMIRDLKGLGLQFANQNTINLLKQFVKISSDCYPETLDKCFVINAPSMFNMLWKLLKPMLKQRTLDKIAIFGSSGYQEALRSVIDLKSLPVPLGGLCSCPGGCVKYLPTQASASADGLQQIEISRGTSYDLPIEVTAGTKVTWTFKLKAHDIKFKVEFAPTGVADDDDEGVETINNSTEQSDEEIKGSHVAKVDGKLMLSWDNSRSMLRSKTVAFKIDVEFEPDEK